MSKISNYTCDFESIYDQGEELVKYECKVKSPKQYLLQFLF